MAVTSRNPDCLCEKREMKAPLGAHGHIYLTHCLLSEGAQFQQAPLLFKTTMTVFPSIAMSYQNDQFFRYQTSRNTRVE
jgi:hypothetical protein